MKYIDISTAHNISVRYELATVMHRTIAWLIDIVILSIYMMLVSIVASSSTVLWYLLVLSVFGFYHLAFELLNNGQSIGKQVMKLKVVTLHGRTAKPQDYFLRWIFRMIEITFTLGMMAILYVSSTEKHQRIGDILAQTTVVKLRPDRNYNLSGLIKLGTDQREITYPKSVMYNDSDMMLVKDALNRLAKDSSNTENRKFINQLSDKISSDLDVSIGDQQRTNFLEKVLLDYISLTR